jgi:signal transduction histidine kinase
MNNQFDSATPEQKLSILTNELRTPIEIIRGYASVIKKDIESNKFDSETVLKEIDRIAESADKIKKLLDELIDSR